MSSVSLEDRLHTPTWWETVREARQQLQLSPIPEKELEEWLTCSGGAFLPECQRVFQKLESGGLPHRYLPYFASCVLAHHQASLRPHGVQFGGRRLLLRLLPSQTAVASQTGMGGDDTPVRLSGIVAQYYLLYTWRRL